MIRPLLIALSAATLLAACGHRGELERPGPMWGEDSDPETEAAERQRRERERRVEERNETTAPGELDDSPI